MSTPVHRLTPRPAHLLTSLAWWCDKTPHPEPCKYYFKKSPRPHKPPPRFRSEFRRRLVELALDHAETTQSQTVRFGPSCTNKRSRAAWSDCVKLYDDTVVQLNRTLRGLDSTAPADVRCTDFDAQTWLSTAQTNIDTCRLGSEDLNVSDFVLPAISNKNLSDLISNCLAVNGALMKQHSNRTTANYREHFPSWISRHERRLLLSTSMARAMANLVVARDGSGHFRSIQAAINVAARRRSMAKRFVIYIKKGVYRENIEVGNDNDNVMLVGDGARTTIVTSGRSVRNGYTTYNSATGGFGGLRVIAKDMTFINTAGPLRGQAVAVRSSSDLAVFYRVGIHGYQDTLYIHSQRQFFRECYISGTIDFIFGNAAVVFQNCMILVRRPLRGQANVITAQARGDPFQNTGITIHSSRIMAASDLRPVVRAYKTYFGRPWQAYSRVTILKSYIDNCISPLGWSPWLRGSNFALDTVFYGEYKNFGPGSSTRWRVRWKGFHDITSPVVASRFTVGSLIAGGSWLAATGVPFKSGL
ncbi:PREDICTED: probable pectinesterase/pectinesterase inhibitor 33 [Tarenaya hassleriana]|uniref:probable pectinesterase/pectinesterase inhibitor 33 n=1 Tax=Tarenaya hassleriana TaxID=28532 RepID=UPI00053C20DB|nr:PREDICTED: probable pectinesterase/pectinesterase inhibitor 33 [Tarenaya hassleriana]